MNARDTPGAVGDVVEAVRANLPALVDRITERILTEVPMYLAGGISHPEEMRSRVTRNIEAAFHGLLGGEHDPTSAIETGRTRARQNMALADVLTGYRLGYSELWSAIVTASRTDVTIATHVAIELGQKAFDTYNRESEAVTEGFRTEAQHLVLQRERERTALLDVLLSDGPGVATLVDVAHGLRLPLDGCFLVVAAATEHGLDPMPRVASTLSAIDVSSVWRLRYDVALGVLSLRDASRNDAVLDLLRRHATGPVGVSPTFTMLGRTAWAVELAQMVLRRLGSAQDVQQVTSSAMNMLVVGGRDAAREAAESILGLLLEQPPTSRDLLLDTLHTWVESKGSADRAAELLHCHPNTVRKRLRRLETLTGRQLGEPGWRDRAGRGIARVVPAGSTIAKYWLGAWLVAPTVWLRGYEPASHLDSPSKVRPVEYDLIKLPAATRRPRRTCHSSVQPPPSPGASRTVRDEPSETSRAVRLGG